MRYQKKSFFWENVFHLDVPLWIYHFSLSQSKGYTTPCILQPRKEKYFIVITEITVFLMVSWWQTHRSDFDSFSKSRRFYCIILYGKIKLLHKVFLLMMIVSKNAFSVISSRISTIIGNWNKYSCSWGERIKKCQKGRRKQQSSVYFHWKSLNNFFHQDFINKMHCFEMLYIKQNNYNKGIGMAECHLLIICTSRKLIERVSNNTKWLLQSVNISHLAADII